MGRSRRNGGPCAFSILISRGVKVSRRNRRNRSKCGTTNLYRSSFLCSFGLWDAFLPQRQRKRRERERETTPGRKTPLQQTPSGSALEEQRRRRRLRDADAEEGTFQTTPPSLPLVTSSETRGSAHHAGTYAMGTRSKLLQIAAWAGQRGYETEPTLPERSRHKPHGCVPPLLGFDVASCGV